MTGVQTCALPICTEASRRASTSARSTPRSAAYGATTLLKGSTTLVAAPADEHPVRLNPTGTAWLATAGSGDVLSGLTGALLAAGLAARDAASVGAYLHGLAARTLAAGAPITAHELPDALPAVWRDVRAA